MIQLKNNHIEAYAFQKPKSGNVVCGDCYYLKATEEYFLCVIADGLGSGEFALESSQTVISVVKENPESSLETLMNYSNQALQRKRGAAVAILKVYFNQLQFEYICVGNIRFHLYTPSGKAIYPLPVSGYLSGRPQRFRTQHFPYEPQSTFLMNSDGFIHVNSRSLFNHFKAAKPLAMQIKEKQVNNIDDVTFIVGSLL